MVFNFEYYRSVRLVVLCFKSKPYLTCRDGREDWLWGGAA
jgi:hypothetical protein